MKPMISILGGDLRQVYLARLLLEDGWRVTTWGLEKGGGSGGVPLDQALEGELLLLPMPVCRNGMLHLPLTDTELEAERLWVRLRYDQLLLGGMTGDLSRRLMADYGLTLLDYYAREETQVANAVPTAEAVGHTHKSLAAQRFYWRPLQESAGDEAILQVDGRHLLTHADDPPAPIQRGPIQKLVLLHLPPVRIGGFFDLQRRDLLILLHEEIDLLTVFTLWESMNA